MQAVVWSHGVLVCVLVAWNVRPLALEFSVRAPRNASILCCLLCEVIYCTSVRGFSLSEGIMCALITVCAKRVASLRVQYVSVAMHAGAVRWSGWCRAEVAGRDSPPGQMGGDAFCTGSGRIKCLPASRPLFLTQSVTLSQLLFPSVSLSLFLFRILHLTRSTIELGSVSGIEWLELMANYLPLWSLECVCVCVWRGAKVMDFAGRSFEGACH